MEKLDAATRTAYEPPPSLRPATSTVKKSQPPQEFDAARLRAQERATLDTARESTRSLPRDRLKENVQETAYQPERGDRKQTFQGRYGQVGLTLDVRA